MLVMTFCCDGSISGTPEFGRAAVFIDDIDRDGCADYAISGGFTHAGRVLCYSGKTGEVLLELERDRDTPWFGRSIALVGDRDGDGIKDLAVGVPFRSPQSSRIEIHSLASGGLLQSTSSAEDEDRLGDVLANIGDVNQDSRIDCVASVRTVDKGLRFVVVSGLDGSRLHVIDAPRGASSQFHGIGVNGLGDLNKDDIPEYAVEYDASVHVIDGSTHREMCAVSHEWHPPTGQPSERFGNCFFVPGDLNGDGTPDVVVGAPGPRLRDGPPFHGRALVFSGKEGVELNAIELEDLAGLGSWGFGFSGAPFRDFDRDRVPDYLMTQFVSGRDRVLVISGKGGRPLAEFNQAGTEWILPDIGWRVASGGDVNGDGIVDVLACEFEPFAQGGDQGVWVLDGSDMKAIRRHLAK